jgi:hypothetical protein
LNDSNVSWNEALPEVGRFVREQRISELPLDWASLSDPALIVPEARPWDCQSPGDSERGRWVAVAAVSILENHNCAYLLDYPHRGLAGGSFYVFHLPESPPPAPSVRKFMWGIPFDFRGWAIPVERHPEQLQAAIETLTRAFRQVSQNPAPK